MENNHKSTIERLNNLGHKGTPFLVLIDFAMRQPQVFPLSDIRPEELLFDINGTTNAPAAEALHEPIYFEKYPISFIDYTQKFNLVQQHIQAGNSFLVNLTVPTPIATNLELRDIFLHSTAKYKLWYKDQFVVFSPEIFVQISDGKIASFPMKGTIDADTPNAVQLILKDKKETAEHNTIVDLIRNDLSMVATNVRVEKLRYLDRVITNGKHLLQVSSKIVGNLPADYRSHLGDILFKLLPAGSITGAPKPKTINIIAQAEQYDRGFYTGIIGLFDGEKLDCGVMIRFIERTPRGLVYKSGGGITSFSGLEKEYQEMIDKVYLPIAAPRPVPNFDFHQEKMSH